MPTDGDWRTGISWMIESELAAFALFALADLGRLAAEGIGAIVSLTEEVPEPLVGERRFKLLHLPIVDMTVPETAQVERFVHFVDRMIAMGRPVGVHCLAGLGRTGTMIACYLVTRGMSAGQAIDHVRSVRPGSIQTEEQEQMVHRWERVRSGEWQSGRFM